MGKWSKLARAKHSARMKERHANKKINGIVSTTSSMSIKSRLERIISDAQSIIKYLGE